MDDKSNKLEGKLVESIKVDGLGDLAQQYVELGLDMVTSGVLKDIPIVGTIVQISKAVGSVRDRLYLKKLVCFLAKVYESTHHQREKFVEDNCQDTQKFEEAVLLILEQADRIEKASLIGKVFKACISGKINYKDALKLSHMVNRAFWGDLQDFIANESLPINESNQSLVTAGLYQVRGSIGTRSRYQFDGVNYDVTEYGKVLFKIANS